MNPHPTILRLIALFAAALLHAPAASAQTTYTWQGGGGINSWSTAGNWVGNVAPPSDLVNTDLVFGSSAFTFPSIQSAYGIHALTFSAGASAYGFDTGPLTLGTGGITQNAANAQAFGALVILGADQTWTLAAGAGSLTFSGGVNTTGGPGNANRTLTINAATTAGSGNTIHGVIFGGGDLIKTGAGTLTLTGNNTFSGSFTLLAGAVGIGNDGALGNSLVYAYGSATLFASGGNRTLGNQFNLGPGRTLSIGADPGGVRNLTLNGAFTGPGGLTVHVPGGTVTLGGGFLANVYSGLTSVTAGTLILNKTPNRRSVGGALSVGNVGAAPPAGTPAAAVARFLANDQTSSTTYSNSSPLTILADGLLDLNDKRADTPSLTMTGGEVRIGTGLFLLTADVTINADAVGAKITSTNFANNVGFNFDSRTFAVADGAALYDLDVQAGVANGTLVKAGAGTVRLAGTTNDQLTVTLNAGILALASNGAAGTSGGTFTLAGGTVVADGGDRTISNPVSVIGNAAIGAGVDGAPRALTFTGATDLAANATLTVSNPAATNFNNLISGAGGILKTGIGTLTLGNSVNTFTGGLTLNGGTLAVPRDASLGGAANLVTFNAGQLLFTGSVSTSRTFILSNAFTLSTVVGTTLTYAGGAGGAGVHGGFLGAGGTHAFTGGSTLNGSTTALGSTVTTIGSVSFNNATLRGATTQIGGTLTATNTVVSSAGTLTVNGTVNTVSFESNGVLTINLGGTVANTGTALVLGGGSRTFVGTVGTPGGTLATAAGTSIELNGGLLVNNGVQSGALNVNFGGVAKGAGTFGMVNVTDGGRFSPGNSPGTATVSSLTLSSGGRYDFELNGANATPGNGADFISVLGNLNAAAGTTPNSVFTIAILSLNGFNQPASLGNFNPSLSYTFTLATAGGGITGFAANEFAVDTGGFGDSLQGGSFVVLQNGNDLQLQFLPVPEPAAALAVLLGGAAVSGLLRRRFRGDRPNVDLSPAEPIADLS